MGLWLANEFRREFEAENFCLIQKDINFTQNFRAFFNSMPVREPVQQ